MRELSHSVRERRPASSLEYTRASVRGRRWPHWLRLGWRSSRWWRQREVRECHLHVLVACGHCCCWLAGRCCLGLPGAGARCACLLSRCQRQAAARCLRSCRRYAHLPRRCPRRCTDPWGPCECRYRQPPAPLYRRTDPAHFCRSSSSFGLGSGWRNDGYGAAVADAAPAGQAAEAAAAAARRAAMQVAAHIAELEADEARAEWRLGDGKKL